jgi:hypothetical protein
MPNRTIADDPPDAVGGEIGGGPGIGGTPTRPIGRVPAVPVPAVPVPRAGVDAIEEKLA